MKVRTGFVSNSSSSSFCIFGIEIDEEGLRAIAKKFKVDVGDEDSYIDTYDLEKAMKEKYVVSFESMEDYHYLGRSFTEIPDNMTGKEFKEQIQQEVNELVGKEKKCNVIEESSYG